MGDHAVLTAIGTDRPGLVDEVSQFIFQNGGNIQGSRMANLHGQFAMMLLVEAPDDSLRNMQAALPALIRHSGLHMEIRPAGRSATPACPAVPYRLTASSLDQAGLVHRIAHLLHSEDVNIESMQTNLVAAPYTGAPIFEIEMAVSVPTNVPLSRLRQELSDLCNQLNIDWQLASM